MNAMLKSTDRPISQTYRLALLDLDGVVYRGKNPVEHAADSIRAAQRAGLQVEYTTNNSSRFQRVVALERHRTAHPPSLVEHHPRVRRVVAGGLQFDLVAAQLARRVRRRQ